MEKVTLSIYNTKKLTWAKDYAKRQKTTLSEIFDKHLSALMALEALQLEVPETLEVLRQPGERPGETELQRHLSGRRKRKTTVK
jgi:hypothetical protein